MRVSECFSDVMQLLQYYAKMGYVCPNYSFAPPHRQSSLFYKNLASEVARADMQSLRNEIMFRFLRGEYGSGDDICIKRDQVKEVAQSLVHYPVDWSIIQNRIMIDMELKFWEHVLLGAKRKKPLKIKTPYKLPVMNEHLFNHDRLKDKKGYVARALLKEFRDEKNFDPAV